MSCADSAFSNIIEGKGVCDREKYLESVERLFIDYMKLWRRDNIEDSIDDFYVEESPSKVQNLEDDKAVLIDIADNAQIVSSLTIARRGKVRECIAPRFSHLKRTFREMSNGSNTREFEEIDCSESIFSEQSVTDKSESEKIKPNLS